MLAIASRFARFSKRAFWWSAVGIVLTALFAACGPAAASSCAPAGSSTQEIELPAGEISRVVSLAPSATEILFAIGAGEWVVGVDDFSNFPAETAGIEKVGALKPDLERIVALSPDLVVAANITDPSVIERIESAGIPVWIADSPDVCGVSPSIRRLGEAIGLDDEADRVADKLERQIADVAARVAGAGRPSVFHELDASDPTKPFTVGPGNFVHSLIELAGGENVFGDAPTPFPQVSLEEVLARDPETIILADAPFGMSVDAVVTRIGWSSITAVVNRNILSVSAELSDQISRPGPRIGDGLEAIARFLHPRRFE